MGQADGVRAPLRVNARLVIPSGELQVSYSRSGGPGGQNVNKVETRVSLRFSVRGSHVLGDRRKALIEERLAPRLTGEGHLVVHASSHRERGRNETEARERLATLLRDALRTQAKRRPTKPTRGSVRRRLKDKRQRSDTKHGRRPPQQD